MFFKVKTTEEVLRLLKGFSPVEMETVPLEASFGRVLGKEIVSPEDLPGFNRSSMDGYAIRAKDSFGATESLPALLEVVGEVKMGRVPTVTVGEGRAVSISTGGMLPEGADGVVMVEYCHLLDEDTLEIGRAISPEENVIRPDDDFKKGSVVLPGGSRLRPQDVGILAGLGITQVAVYKKPKVAIISTGDEVVPIDQSTKPGQVRDINSYTLDAFCRMSGVEPFIMGLSKDHFDQLRDMLEKGLAVADTVWISGGSSVGTRDLTLKVFESFKDMEVLVHGISISPGKPTVIARMGHRAIFGLPGHTASAMVVAEVFLGPFLARLSGVKDSTKKGLGEVQARLSRNIESAGGRDDFIRVRLTEEGEGWVAEPIFGKSGLICTLVEADGLVRVDRNTEGLYEGEMVKVLVFDARKGECS
ncbi:MAG: molybdopterin molybdotransferase MoeA [Desulfobacterales bacterium]|nr:molybdopterin molybdotransferase MoeA [Desulfobacterales bacterium]